MCFTIIYLEFLNVYCSEADFLSIGDKVHIEKHFVYKKKHIILEMNIN